MEKASRHRGRFVRQRKGRQRMAQEDVATAKLPCGPEVPSPGAVPVPEPLTLNDAATAKSTSQVGVSSLGRLGAMHASPSTHESHRPEMLRQPSAPPLPPHGEENAGGGDITIPTAEVVDVGAAAPAPPAFGEVATERIRMGLCPDCGAQLFERTRREDEVTLPYSGAGQEKALVPLTVPGAVLRGRCLLCHPLPAGVIEGVAAAASAPGAVMAPPRDFGPETGGATHGGDRGEKKSSFGSRMVAHVVSNLAKP